MGRWPRARRGLAVPLVVALVSFLFLGVAAVSFFRRGATRNLAGMLHRLDGIGLATAAIAEVAQPARLEQLFAAGGGRDALVACFRGGRREGGALYPAPMQLSVPAERLAARASGDPSLTLSSVRLQPLVYFPGDGSQKGVMRFTVEVTRSVAGRETRVVVAEDYEFTMYREGMDGLRFLISLAPSRRVLS